MLGTRTFISPIAIGDHVICDGAADLKMAVTAVLFRAETPQIEVSYFHDGVLKNEWVSPWRLTVVKHWEIERDE